MFRFFRRFPHAFRGIIHALRTDFSFRTQALIGATFVAGFGYFLWPITNTEFLFLALAGANILITELQNSSFEAALDRLHPEWHDQIGRSKDMAAGSVLIAGLFALLVVGVIVYSRVVS